MSWWSRLVNVFRGERVSHEIDEELRAHLADAVAAGRDPGEARRALGGALQLREASRDFRMVAWVDSLRADLIFGVRQLVKNRTASVAAILSLGLAIGACVATFRLVDALLLRPLPVASPERLYYLTIEYLDHEDKVRTDWSFDYPLFRRMRAAVADRAELMALNTNSPADVTFGGDQDMERVRRQYVSGWTMGTFGLKPALGRLLTAQDDQTPGAHSVAVISYDYWNRRFGRDPKAVGRTFRNGNDVIQIVGVLEEGFTGTETGSLTDLYMPTMMNARAINNASWGWIRIWVQLKPGVELEPVRDQLRAVVQAVRREKVKGWSASIPKERVSQYLNAGLSLEPAVAGVSNLQRDYRRSMLVLAVLVALVLLIAAANVANLMTAQAAARAREMALRISIGAGRRRLVQMVLVESALIASAASLLGFIFAWVAAPLVLQMIGSRENPVRLDLPADWRVMGFAIGLTLLVTVLFGLAPALRASGVAPASALKGGEDALGRHRLMNALVAAQVAFCFLVHFMAGLFVSSFDRMREQPLGFSTERVLLLNTASKEKAAAGRWNEVLNQVRSVGGVESAALAGWPLMSGNGWSQIVLLKGESGTPREPYFLGVSPGWFATMKVPLLGGRDFRVGDREPQAAIVNESFVRQYLQGRESGGADDRARGRRGERDAMQIVGYVGDARYRNLREAVSPTVYVPFGDHDWGTVVVKTRTADPFALAESLRREVGKADVQFRVGSTETQAELVEHQTIRERALAALSVFFAGLAMLLAGIGLYGVLDYSVLQRRREIGIRMALGARADDIARRVTFEMFAMLVCGAAVGLGLGVLSERFVESLLFGVKATDWFAMAWPLGTIFVVSLLAALPPVMRAVRIDPALMLRAE